MSDNVPTARGERIPPMKGSFLKILKRAALAAMVLMYGLVTPGQMVKGCSGIAYLGADPINPFTAKRVITSTMPTPAGVPKTNVREEIVARDSQGRIRIEKRGVGQPPGDSEMVVLETADGKPFTVTREEYGTVIEIFDCASGISTLMQPGMRIATVKEDKTTVPRRQVKRAYSTPYIPGPGVKIPPKIIIEQLGIREIQGIPARGVKTTSLGTEDDGEWDGKPLHQTEVWISDELAAHMMKVDRDLRSGSEARMELIAVRREEPDPGLFDIPMGYKINPAIPGELPIRRSFDTPRPVEK
jgi:hypothetical protein